MDLTLRRPALDLTLHHPALHLTLCRPTSHWTLRRPALNLTLCRPTSHWTLCPPYGSNPPPLFKQDNALAFFIRILVSSFNVSTLIFDRNSLLAYDNFPLHRFLFMHSSVETDLLAQHDPSGSAMFSVYAHFFLI